jgi:hypothetical protein
LINFSCKCGHKIVAAEVHAGKQGRCPKCKEMVVIPQAATDYPDDGSLKLTLSDTRLALSFPTVEHTPKPATGSNAVEAARILRQEKDKSSEIRPHGERRLPWPIDIFLYPTSGAGLTQLGIFLGIPFLIWVLTVATGPFGMFIGMPGIIVMLIIYAYMGWYVCECIRDSGNGGVRAPDVLTACSDPWEVFCQLLKIAACYAFFLTPMIIYLGLAKRYDTVFWVLAGGAAFFFPMGLLAVTMLESLGGLNPILLIGSMVRVFFSYCVMVVGLAAVLFLIVVFAWKMETMGVTRIIAHCVGTYLLLVAAHLLGRFYYRKAAKLNWDV